MMRELRRVLSSHPSSTVRAEKTRSSHWGSLAEYLTKRIDWMNSLRMSIRASREASTERCICRVRTAESVSSDAP